MRNPELSVVMPVYGRQEDAARAVRSVMKQDVALEVVVVDDGSPTPLVLESTDDRVNLIRFADNRGAAAARNAGVHAARGDWIAFLDSDDVWPEHSLRPRLEAARTSGDPARTIWASAFVYVRPGGARRQARTPRASSDARDFASGCWSCPGATALMSRAAWERGGGQDESLRRLEDYEWLFRWGLEGGRLAVHPIVGAEIGGARRASVAALDAAAKQIRAKHSAIAPGLARRMESYLQLEVGVAGLYGGSPVVGAFALARSWLLHPRLQPALEPFWTR